ncbi:MAG: DUF2076 family protein [Pseudomonadota bacterium]
MRADERAAIEALFEKLEAAGPEAAAPDLEAQALIAAKLAETPHAAYRMAQTIIGLEHALEAAGAARGAAAPQPGAPRERSFLGGAAQTALAVTGGLLLADLISGGIGDVAEAAPGADASEDASGAEDDGFDLGGMLDIFN